MALRAEWAHVSPPLEVIRNRRLPEWKLVRNSGLTLQRELRASGAEREAYAEAVELEFVRFPGRTGIHLT